jgi:hypothetical protein
MVQVPSSLFVFALAGALAAQVPQWLPTGSQPRARFYGAMANDPIHGRPLLFSGDAPASFLTGFVPTADLWEWSGRRWARRPSTGPAPRSSAAMCTDLVRRRVVLFGGVGANGTVLRDTWEYDGEVWQHYQLPIASSPDPDYGHAMAYDLLRSRTVLLTSDSVTWEWNGTSWTQPQGLLPPPPRRYGAMVYDLGTGRMVLCCGQDPINFAAHLDDTWTYDGVQWSLQSVGAPGPRSHHSMAFDSVRQRIVLFGGQNQIRLLRDTWEFGPTGWQLRPSAAQPDPVDGGSIAFDPQRRVTLLVTASPAPGGGVMPTTWSWDGTAWTLEAVPPLPPRRVLHGFVRDVAPGSMLAFGGATPAQDPLGDTWRWDGARWYDVTPATSPAPRYSFAIAHDAARGRVVLFGGARQGAVFGDTWTWDGTAWTQAATPTAPPGRAYAAMAFDAQRGACLLFGGASITQNFDDTWTWNGTAWQLAAATGPGARTEAAMTFDAGSGDVLLFGGHAAASAGPTNDLWRWNGTAWSQVATPAPRPAPRTRHALAHDPVRGRTLLHGGNAGTSADSWEWNGSAWTQTWTPGLVAAPTIVGTATMAFEPVRGSIVLYDGLDPFVYATSPATAQSYGSGCAGGSIQLAAPERPYFGNDAFHLEVSDAPRFQPCALFAGLQQAVVPLPGACALLVAQPVTLGFAAIDHAGGMLMPVPLPPHPAAMGLLLFAQAAALDATTALGAVLSNGLRLRIGE